MHVQLNSSSVMASVADSFLFLKLRHPKRAKLSNLGKSGGDEKEEEGGGELARLREVIPTLVLCGRTHSTGIHTVFGPFASSSFL